jgi:hypothetical protein
MGVRQPDASAGERGSAGGVVPHDLPGRRRACHGQRSGEAEQQRGLSRPGRGTGLADAAERGDTGPVVRWRRRSHSQPGHHRAGASQATGVAFATGGKLVVGGFAGASRRTAAPQPNWIAQVPSRTGSPGARYAITWPDGTVRNRWLEVTVNPSARTGLATPDVFYFGNLVGDTGVTPLRVGRARLCRGARGAQGRGRESTTPLTSTATAAWR